LIVNFVRTVDVSQRWQTTLVLRSALVVTCDFIPLMLLKLDNLKMEKGTCRSFRDLKSVLSKVILSGTPDLPLAVKERALSLCACFLGGAWKEVPVQKFSIQRMSGGLSNVLLLCQHELDVYPDSTVPCKILLRIYFNPETETNVVEESVTFMLLSERQLGPKLYGIFPGGRLEEYIPSRPLSAVEVRQSHFSRQIAAKMAQFHALSVPLSKEPTYLFDALKRWMRQLKNNADRFPEFLVRFDNKVISLNEERLLQEINLIRYVSILGYNSLPKLIVLYVRKPPLLISERVCAACVCASSAGELWTTFCIIDHLYDICIFFLLFSEISPTIANRQSCFVTTTFKKKFDFSGNILLPNECSSHKDIMFIDFEYSSYNYRGFDLANHFCEWIFDCTITEPPGFVVEPSHFPTEAEQLQFFSSYLEELKKPVDADVLEFMLQEVSGFVPVSHMLWGVWALLQNIVSPMQADFNFMEYAKTRMSLYFHLRPALLRALPQYRHFLADHTDMLELAQSQAVFTR
ncbi:Choline/ethanolamine kinase, partial [Trichinella nelsoni]